MKNGLVSILAGAVRIVLASAALAAEPTQVERVQAALDAWLAARAPIEKVTGIAAYISFGDTGPAIEAFAGKVGRDADARPRRPGHALPHGEHVEVVHRRGDPPARSGGKALDRRHARQVAAGISGVEGRHHPPAPQHDERHSQLFRNRVDVPGMGGRPMRDFTLKELADAAYPSATNKLPVTRATTTRTPTTFSPA